METVLNPDDITCGICFEVFDNPKILPCVHTFCEKCISDYIEHNESSSYQKGFACPMCREFVSIPNPSQNIKEWASQLKSNYFMNNVIQAVGPDPKAAVSEAHQTMCSKHMKEIDLMCIDCDALVCNTCVAVAHRTCRQVYTLKEAADEKRSTLTYLLKGVDAKLQRADIVLTELSKEKSSLEREVGKALAAVESVFDQMRKALERVLTTTKTKVTERYEDAFKVLQTEMKNTEKAKNYLQQLVKEADTMLSSPQDVVIVGQSQKMEALLKQHQPRLDIREGKIPGFSLEFLPVPRDKWTVNEMGKVKLTTFQKKVELPVVMGIDRVMQAAGVIPVSKGQPASLGSPTSPSLGSASILLDPKLVVTCTNKVAVKIKEDKSKPQVRDMVVIPGDVIVLTDGGNNAVKSFYTQGPQLQYSRYVTEGQPHGVTVLSGNTIAVTVPRQKEILVLNVTPNIFLQKKIGTSKRYWAITAVTPEALAVSVCPGGEAASVELVNLHGQTVRVIRDRIMSNPLYMACVPTGDIIITDPTIQPGIVSLRQNGHVVFKYPESNIKRAMGVTIDKDGSILVVDQKSGSVMLLHADGSYVRTLLTMDGGKAVGVAVGARGLIVCAREDKILEYSATLGK